LQHLLDLPFFSHGHATLKDLDASVRFYREFLGFEVIRTSKRTLVARLGSNTVIVGVTLGEKGLAKNARPWLENAHFGLDLATADEVREARELALENQDEFGILHVGNVIEGDGGAAFMLTDQDGNFWEILENPPGGFSGRFQGTCETGHALRSFRDPAIEEQRTSVLKPCLLSHVTVEVINLAKSREFYETMFGLEIVQLGPKRMLARLNSVAVMDIIETDTTIRDHKMHNHIGFDVAGPDIVDSARVIVADNQDRFSFEVIHKPSGSHGSYGFTFSDLDSNAWQIEDYPRGGYYWMFEQGGDLVNPFQPNVAGATDWHELIDPETYEYRGTREIDPAIGKK
jgi:catechol 2,3-dioxygenase-like lactoylglutathione lyase family enzyme